MSSYSITPLRRRAIRARAAFARLGASASLLTVLVLAACSSADKSITEPVTPPVVPPPGSDPGTPTTGIASVAPTGLPAGISSRVLLSKGGVEHLLVGTSSVAGLAAGEWTATAQTVVADGVTYLPTPVTQTVTVTSAGTVSINVAYGPNTGTLSVTVSGLPAGGVGDIVITGPDNYRRAIGTTLSINALTAGKYHLESRGVKLSSGSFAPVSAQQDVDVVAGNTPAAATVAYVSAPSVVNVNIAGLPGGSAAAVTLTPPTGSNINVTASTRLPAALAGRWQMAATTVKASGFTWTPSPASKDTSVASGDSLAFNVQYAVSTGAIAFLVSGLPDDLNGAISVSGPAGFQRSITKTTTVTDLAPGVYTVSVDSVKSGSTTYRSAVATQQITVTPSLVASNATIAYSSAVAKLTISIAGSPIGATNMIEVKGPSGFNQFVSGTTTFTNVAPGQYSVIASPIILPGGFRYEGSPTNSVRTLNFGTDDTVRVNYVLGGGKAAITVAGLPAGTNAAVTLAGNNVSTPITGSVTVDNLAPGNYTLSAAVVTVGTTVYNPSPLTSTLAISSGNTTNATITYTGVVTPPPVTKGKATITVAGLPAGNSASIVFAGTGVNRSITATTTIDSLNPATYTITAAPVVVSGTTYNPSPASSSVAVSAGNTAALTITYSAGVVTPPPAAGFNLILDGFYLTQAIQKMDGSVALIANRDALLRVFVHASEANTVQPAVRVRIYDGATLLQTLTLNAPEASVRTVLNEGQINSTWNTVIPAANVRNALRVVADVDPAGAIAESDETDNSWPRNQTPQSITVNTAPTFNVRFVPVTVGALTGNVSNANKEQFLLSTRRMHPISSINSDVRAPFTSSASTLQAGDGNGAWLTVLSEMNALRTADGAPSTTHYYGVVKVGYNSGVAGYGYVPGRAAMGWDYLPSGDEVAVHEWGHNFGRPHTNCGGPDSPDMSYPYAGGAIGMWGWNPTTGQLVSPTATDVMGYCNNQWISDWTWTRVMNQRASAGMVASASVLGSSKQEGLLVWGRIVNGKVMLEPALRVNSRPSPASMSGTHRVQALDARGNSLLELAFNADRVDHVQDRDERHFAVVLPWSLKLERALATLRVTDVRQPLSIGTMTSVSTMRAVSLTPNVDSVPVVMPASGAKLSAVNATRTRVEWNKAQYSMAVARDANTGEIMAFVRNPGDVIITNGRPIELIFSDGVRSRMDKPLR